MSASGNRGGRRQGAGRKKGQPNKRTAEREQRVAEAAAVIESALPDSFKGDAHAYLMTVYKNQSLPVKDRLAAATAAIGYEKPKLAAIEHSGEMTMTYEDKLAEIERLTRAFDEGQPGHAH